MLKTILRVVFLFICSISVYAQHSFQKGYFVTQNNDRVECLIRNEDWNENPLEFKYKLNEESKEHLAGVDSILCFMVDSTHKYIKREVKVDLSSEELSDFSYKRAPEYETQILFLKVLVEGEYNLYYYEGDKLTRFFIQPEGGETIQLIYKTYFTQESSIAKNEQYRGQLAAFMQCDERLRMYIMNMSYTRKSMIRLFKKYAACSNQPFNFIQPNKKGHVSLKSTVGLGLTNVETFKPALIYVKRSNILAYHIGAELEYFFPIKNDKLSLIAEPSFHIERTEYNLDIEHDVDYKLNFLRLPLGLRYHTYFKNGRSLYFNSGLLFSSSLGSTINFYTMKADGSRLSSAYEVRFSPFSIGVFAGVGYRLNNLSFEGRFTGLTQESTLEGELWRFKHNTFMLKAAYCFDLSKKK